MNGVTLHFRGQISLEDMVSCLETTVGHTLSKVVTVDWNLYRTACFGLEFNVYEIDLDDDCGIPFSGYSIVVSIGCLADAIEPNYAETLQEMIGRVIARAACNDLSVECIIVRNLQHLVDKYHSAAYSVLP